MTFRHKRPCVLLILDGWGLGEDTPQNAVKAAFTPNLDHLFESYPTASLEAAGASVGLSPDSPGNAEAGHFNLGAGRVVKSDVSRVKEAITSGEFFNVPVLKAAMGQVKNTKTALHLIGLVSDGDVHSSSETLYALLRMAKRSGVEKVFVHGILDGRDVPQRSAEIFIEALEIKMNDIGLGQIATMCGRHFGMNAEENWDRTARCYTMLVHAEGERANDASSAIRSSYLRGIDDEFIAPIILESENGEPVGTVREGDTVIFFNHRADTMRQLVRTLAVPDPLASTATKPTLNVVCLTEYDRSFGLPVAFPIGSEGLGLGAVFSREGVPNYRFAEPERFPHITSFLNGGSDSSSQYQQNIAVVGPKLSVHDSYPEMGSFKLADRLISAIESDGAGLFIANFSAADLIAETGELDKTIESLQFIDTCIGGIYDAVSERRGLLMITSSHGNCEMVVSPDGQAQLRSGTPNKVPFLYADTDEPAIGLRSSGTLCDVAPTLLGALGLEYSEGMTGSDLRTP